MRTRLLVLALAGGLAVTALPADAAKAKPQLTDPAGDANGINGQGFLIGGPADGASTPADLSAADITAVTFASTFKKKKVKDRVVKVPTGFTVTMALSAAPTTPEIFYRVIAPTAGCDSVFFEYGTDVATAGSDVRCPATPPAEDKEYPASAAIVKGNTITWKVPISAFPAGTTFSKLEAHTRFNPAVVTAPQIDTASSSATFTVGQ
jgi:hypothetical protein